MNPAIRHFLPSVVRGVYRADDEFSAVKDAESFANFVKTKLRFLPPEILAKFRHHFSFDGDFENAKRRLTLASNLFDSSRTSVQRAKSFFQQHPYFQNALGEKAAIEGADNYLEVHFVQKILALLLSDEGMRMVRPQHQVGPYFLDFAVIGESKFAIEVDGFGKFKERADLDNFIKRQNYITSQGWRVIRFTYAQIKENTGTALKLFHSLLKNDTQLQRFLVRQEQSGFVWESADTENPQALAIVNDFYRVQDHFTETVLAAGGNAAPIQVCDSFKLGVPFVALAISALYKFLDSVQSVVDIDFDLPAVEVSGASCSKEWSYELHYLVKTKGVARSGVPEFNAANVQFQPATLPAPPRDARRIRFRAGLTLEAIQQRLQYFCSGIFGYEKTKPFQNLIFQRVFNGEHVLGISATGSGKSLCFWLPALLRPGLTLIICPLRSLMRDQHLSLRNNGIACADFINSDVNKLDQRRIMEEARLGSIRLLYISPERLRIKKFLEELAQLQKAVPINFLAVDEAHCISEWGHDFRPAYLKLPFLREKLTKENEELQLIALTATAGQQVERDMLGILKLKSGDDGQVARDRGADRPKFSYQMIPVQAGQTKTQAYEEILIRHLPTALKQRSLPDLLKLKNARNEKAVGLVFCIYADPHGKHSIHDGVAHYLFETMSVIEPAQRFEGRRRIKKLYREDAFSTGQVRAYASKTPTFCPECHSYEYTSKAFTRLIDEDEEEDQEGGDGEPAVAPRKTGGRKICGNCKHEFDGADHGKPDKWEKVIKANQADFKESKFNVLVATKGFGMGIDKSSVRFVIHTSLSSGIESWYQEIGRAGRDNERAHIVLLVDPPNAACQKELKAKGAPMIPSCKSYKHCPHGRDSLCDYGKQHMFISKSYPGVESDAVSALRVLDKLITAREKSSDGTVSLSSSNDYLSHTELAIYRLTLLGLVDDYVVTYRRNPYFDVEFLLPESLDSPAVLASVDQKMRARLSEHLSHFSNSSNSSHKNKQKIEYQPLENSAAKTKNFTNFLRYEKLFKSVYQHLLLQLHHTYTDVVTMRYDMLWNLQTIVTSQECRRTNILPYFGESPEKKYRCGCCDICSPKLNFLETRVPPKVDASMAEKEIELAKAFSGALFDRVQLIRLRDDFADYPTAKYRQARSILEGDPNNLSALFFAREFSPLDEYAANDRRLLRTANQNPLPLCEVVELYKSSTAPKAELLLTLNEADTSCDSPTGWEFLRIESAKPQNHRNPQVAVMNECLDFMLWVDDDLSDTTETLKRKARELENAFSYA